MSNEMLLGIFIGFVLGIAMSLGFWLLTREKKESETEEVPEAPKELFKTSEVVHKTFKKPKDDMFSVLPPDYNTSKDVEEEEEVTGQFSRASLLEADIPKQQSQT